MYIVGRRDEQILLEDCVRSHFPEFLAVYGRRRIGKTYLIREFFGNQFAFYGTGIADGNRKVQLTQFYQALREYGDSQQGIPKDWFEAFSRLKAVLGREEVIRDFDSNKKVVFLDEIPWMDTPRSDFKSALEWFWNSWGSAQEDLLLIICGSATSWIIDNVFHNTGGLYNRVTKRMHLKPFTLRECEDFFRMQNFAMTRGQITECYMIFGGVPYYLRLLSQRYSIHQDVERLFFAPGGQLRDEFRHLYASLFKNSDAYVRVIRALASRNSGMTREEIVSVSGMDSGGQLTKILEELAECDFIRKYSDYTKQKSGCIFQLIDAFTLFYLTFVESRRISSWLDYLHSPAYHAWTGFAFERVCLLHVPQIKEALKIAGITSSEYAWRSAASSPGVQIDLLIDRRDSIIDLCEIKYTTAPYALSKTDRQALVHKREVFREESRTDKAIHIILISANGFKKGQEDGVIQHRLMLEDLFS